MMMMIRKSVVIRVHLLHSGTSTVHRCLHFKLQFTLCTEINYKYIVSNVVIIVQKVHYMFCLQANQAISYRQ